MTSEWRLFSACFNTYWLTWPPERPHYLDLLRAFIDVILTLACLLHQLRVTVLLHLLLVFQSGHLLALVLHLPARCTNLVKENLQNVYRRNVHYTDTQISFCMKNKSIKQMRKNSDIFCLSCGIFSLFFLSRWWRMTKKKREDDSKQPKAGKKNHICRCLGSFFYSKRETDSVCAKLHWEEHCRPITSVLLFTWLRRLNSVLTASWPDELLIIDMTKETWSLIFLHTRSRCRSG